MNDLILKKSILIYTDGACKGNPGPGGWGAIIATPDGQVTELGRAHQRVTNNKMEMLAVIEALQHISGKGGDVAILTDSTYVIQGITQWIWGWLRKGWKTASGSDVNNRDLWQRMLTEVQNRKSMGEIGWHYVRGHAGVEGNERADKIASAFALRERLDLYQGILFRYPYDIYNIPDDTSLPDRSQKPKSSAKNEAYSYLSCVNGELKIHKTWAECEARIRGRSYAKSKKALSREDEERIKQEWGF